MERYAEWQVRGHIASALEDFLRDNGMKRGWVFRRTFSKEGVRVNYTYDRQGRGGCVTFNLGEQTTEVYLRAKTAAQAVPVYAALSRFFAENYGEIHCEESTELFSGK